MPTDITPEQRAELRRMEAEATPGPWGTTHNSLTEESRVWAGEFVRCLLDGRVLLNERINADFIAAARNALPALLDAADERDALRERLAEVTRDRDALLSACEAVRADKFASLSASAWAGILSALAGR